MTDAKTTILTRTYHAPAALVFACFIKPEHLLHWYSAGNGWTTPHARSDAREGGRFDIGFADPEGKMTFDFTGVYNEITPPAPGRNGRLHYTIDDGRPVWVEFAEAGGKTTITLTLTLETTHSEEQQRHGWGAMLANLQLYLAQSLSRKESGMTLAQKIYAERTLTLTRILKAPRDLVWRAWTDHEQLKQWWGPEGFTNPVVEGDIKVGGTLHITMHGPKGSPFDIDLPMVKRYREIVPGKKLVFENEPIGADGERLMDSVTTITFADHPDGTLMEMTTTAKALTERSVGFLSGMEQGWGGSFDKLSRLLAA